MSEQLTVRGRVVTPDGVLEDGIVVVAGERITDVRAAETYADHAALPEPSGTVLPGLVDVHCHGGGGASFTSGEPDQVATAARHHLGQGTTSLVASSVSDSPDRMLATVRAAAAAVERGEIAAIHVEGPFLAVGRCGAQDPTWLRTPDMELARQLIDAGGGHVYAMTIAPELPGAGRLIDWLSDHDVVVAVGHTEAGAATTERALDRGGRGSGGLVTHLFNGMPPMHHRDPGPVVGALSSAARGRATVELVADGVHVSDEIVRMVFDLLGGERIALVTDAMAAAGMPSGDYRLGPQDVSVRDGVARLHGIGGSTSIAGGTSRLIDVVRRCVQRAGVGLVEAVTAASATPAAVLGLDAQVGALRPGLRADVVVVDDDVRPRRVLRAGEWVA